jgi:hypothetical protein
MSGPGTWPTTLAPGISGPKIVTFVNVGKGTYHFGHDDDLGENPADSGYSNG